MLSNHCYPPLFFFFFFNDTATTEIYTLSLHDALPIFSKRSSATSCCRRSSSPRSPAPRGRSTSTTRSEEHTSELSHSQISYAVFCLKKKKKRSVALVSGLKLLSSYSVMIPMRVILSID